MSIMGKLPDDHPLMLAWTRYKASADFANTRRWMVTGVISNDLQMMDGQFWGAFVAGWDAALKVGEKAALDAIDAACAPTADPTGDTGG